MSMNDSLVVDLIREVSRAADVLESVDATLVWIFVVPLFILIFKNCGGK